MRLIKLIITTALIFLPIISTTISLCEDFKSKEFEIIIKKILSDDIRSDINNILLVTNDNTTLKKLKFDIVSSIDDDHLLCMEKQRKIYDIPKEIYYRQIWKESLYNPNAKSHVGATGYMQIMPNTFIWIKDNYNPRIMNTYYKNNNDNKILNKHISMYIQEINRNYNTENYYLFDINDPYDNIRGGTYLMRYLKNKIDEKYPDYDEYKKWKRTLSSYNAGYGVHNIALKNYKETQDYVKFILHIYKQTS